MASFTFRAGGGGDATFGSVAFPATPAVARSSAGAPNWQPDVEMGGTGHPPARALPNGGRALRALKRSAEVGRIVGRSANQHQSHSWAGTMAVGGALQAAAGPCTAAVVAANSFALTAQPATNHPAQGHQPLPAAHANQASRTHSPAPVETTPGSNVLEGSESLVEMFGRSASASAGGLSINTGAANAG